MKEQIVLQKSIGLDDIEIRKAQLSDVAAIGELIRDSARILAKVFYSSNQIEAALLSAWGVDTQLILDGTYFVCTSDSKIVGCGGWSRRQTLFGGDHQNGRVEGFLDPLKDPARIRAFFIHPKWARKGIGKRLFLESESEARKAGFHVLELVATLSGQSFYKTLGFVREISHNYPLRDGIEIEFISMKKILE